MENECRRETEETVRTLCNPPPARNHCWIRNCSDATAVTTCVLSPTGLEKSNSKHGETRCEDKPCKCDAWCSCVLSTLSEFHESDAACLAHGRARLAYQSDRSCDEASWKTISGRSAITLSIRVPISKRRRPTSLSQSERNPLYILNSNSEMARIACGYPGSFLLTRPQRAVTRSSQLRMHLNKV